MLLQEQVSLHQIHGYGFHASSDNEYTTVKLLLPKKLKIFIADMDITYSVMKYKDVSCSIRKPCQLLLAVFQSLYRFNSKYVYAI